MNKRVLGHLEVSTVGLPLPTAMTERSAADFGKSGRGPCNWRREGV
ncbi:MAG: hypothetical protein MR004_01095 [Clostridiales bacterium]|nr:hypothetical protein [Clostridiales bacterium]